MLSSGNIRPLPSYDFGRADGPVVTAQAPSLFSVSTRSRPLSTTSGVSLASTTSTSSYTFALDRRRRSAALLELAADDATRLSLQRAEGILRASEDARARDQRRSASLRSRGSFVHDLTRSTGQVTFEIPSSVSSLEELRGGDEDGNRDNVEPSENLRRFSPKRFLLGRPRPPRHAATTKFNTISSPMAPAPSPPRNVVSDRPRGRGIDTQNVPRSAAPARSEPARRFGTLPSHFSRLHPPPDDSLSKFSGSSSGSLVGIKGPSREEVTVKLDEKPRRAPKRGFKALRQKLAGTRRGSIEALSKPLRKRGSFASLFGLAGAVPDEASSTDDRQTSSKPATTSASSQQTHSNSGASSHRPSTSISSFATSSASATGSVAASRSSSRLGFFRTLGRRSSLTSGRSSRQSRVSGQISTSSISAPLPLASPQRSYAGPDPTTRATDQAHAKVAQLPVELGPSPLRKKGWLSTWGRSAGGQNVATKRALFEPEGGTCLYLGVFGGAMISCADCKRLHPEQLRRLAVMAWTACTAADRRNGLFLAHPLPWNLPRLRLLSSREQQRSMRWPSRLRCLACDQRFD